MAEKAAAARSAGDDVCHVGRLPGHQERSGLDAPYRLISEPIYYDDGEVVHFCVSAIMDRGVRLVWPKCDIDVLDNQGFTVEGEAPTITCPKCRATIE